MSSFGNDPFAVLQEAAEVLITIGAIFVVCFAIHCHSTQKRGRYASNLGSALQKLQAIARPSIEHQLE